jgi:hypothetical protein
MPGAIYQALMLGAVAIIGAGVAWVVAVLGRLAREQNARGRENQVRDIQRGEILENVRRLTNGSALIVPTERLTKGRHRVRPDRRRGARRAPEIKPHADDLWMERKGLGLESKDDQAGDDQS